MSYRTLRIVVAGIIGVLFLYSLHLAINRIIQVDEAQNMYMARIIGSGQTSTYFANPAIFLLGPLAWIAESATTAKEAFVSGRLIFVGIYWLNLFLLVKCTGTSLRTSEGLLAALLAATLAPLWDYGFEIRHDNLLLTGLLLIWWAGRLHGHRMLSFFVVGVIVTILQFTTFKAFVYTLPISAYLLTCRYLTDPASSGRAIGAWMAGVLVAGLACVGVYLSLGLLTDLVDNVAGVAEATQSGRRFFPFDTLARLLHQTPLLVAVAVAALLSAVFSAAGRPKDVFDGRGLMPEAVLLSVAILALLINPTPFPYNLVCLVPFAYLLAFRFIRELATAGKLSQPMLALAVSVFLFSHLVPFLQATLRHTQWNNWRQMSLAAAAEALTDPTDPVYDAAGLVVTRPSIGHSWYLHSLNMQRMYGDEQNSVAAMLAQNPAAVLMPNYRFDWLPKSDWQFIGAHYLPVADDFWVLGARVTPDTADLRVLRAGRYQLLRDAPRSTDTTTELVVDGRPVASNIVVLTAGNHTVRTGDDSAVTVVWLGPTLDQLPPIQPGNHRRLFSNWY